MNLTDDHVASLQTPYLISLALLFVTYLPSFPASPRTTFRLLRKLDLAFSSLLQGCDPDTGETLPGFERQKSLSTTEKVRIKSLVERTRVVMVEVMAKDEREDETEADETVNETTDEDDDDDDDDMTLEYDNEDEWDMEIAKAYDRTLVELGESLGGEGRAT